MTTPEVQEGLSLHDKWMRLSPELQGIVPKEALSYYETTNKMHFDKDSEGGSKFEGIDDLFELLKMVPNLAERIKAGEDDREQILEDLRAAGASTDAIKPFALYYKVENIEGRVGIRRVGDISGETRVIIRREKGVKDPEDKYHAAASFTVVQGSYEELPQTSFGTIIAGKDDKIVWTAHPDIPITPASEDFDLARDLPGPKEVPEGEKQPALIMTIDELKAKGVLSDDQFIKYIPGDIDEVSKKYQIL